jgi:hypothetical protein
MSLSVCGRWVKCVRGKTFCGVCVMRVRGGILCGGCVRSVRGGILCEECVRSIRWGILCGRFGTVIAGRVDNLIRSTETREFVTTKDIRVRIHPGDPRIPFIRKVSLYEFNE